MNCQLVDFAKRNFIFRYSALFIALVSLMTLIACGGRGEPSEEEPAIPSITAPSQTGPREVPVSGSLTFPNTASLTFESPGIVGEILVSEGDEVQTGQPLASLDAQTVSQLEVALALAQVRVTTAENGLESLRLDPALMIANAELEVARAEVGLDEAQKALDDLLQRPGINSEAAQLAVVQAEIALDDARERLDDLLAPKRLAVSALEAQVAAAKVELDAAQEAYDDIKDGSFPDEVLRDARNGVAFATTAHEVAVRTGADARTAAQNALIRAQDGEYLVRERYIALYEFWFGAELTDAELQMTTSGTHSRVGHRPGRDLPSLQSRLC